MPLTRKVQLDSRRQEPEEVSDTERKAYERLLAKWKGAPLAVQVVGPLSRDSEGALLLQVRQWKLSKPVQFRAVRQP